MAIGSAGGYVERQWAPLTAHQSNPGGTAAALQAGACEPPRQPFNQG